MQPDENLVTRVAQRLIPLETARPMLRRRIVLNTLLLIFLVVLALPTAFAAAAGAIWLLGTYVSKSIFSVIVGFVLGVGVVSYGAFRVVAPLFSRAAAIQDSYGQRLAMEFVLPQMHEAMRGVRVTPESVIDHETFRASRLFGDHREDLFDSALGFSGSSDGIPWRGARVCVYRKMHNRQENRVWETYRLRGWYVRLDLKTSWVGTVRLVDRGSYSGSLSAYRDISGAANIVTVDSGNAAFDALGQVVLDAGEPELPALPAGLITIWLAVRERLQHPVFLSLNDSGVYLAIATGDGPLPLDYRWVVASDPVRLAADLETLRELPGAIGQLTGVLSRCAW